MSTTRTANIAAQTASLDNSAQSRRSAEAQVKAQEAAVANARAQLAQQCADALARLHAAPVSHWADLPLKSGSGADLLADPKVRAAYLGE